MTMNINRLHTRLHINQTNRPSSAHNNHLESVPVLPWKGFVGGPVIYCRALRKPTQFVTSRLRPSRQHLPHRPRDIVRVAVGPLLVDPDQDQLFARRLEHRAKSGRVVERPVRVRRVERKARIAVGLAVRAAPARCRAASRTSRRTERLPPATPRDRIRVQTLDRAEVQDPVARFAPSAALRDPDARHVAICRRRVGTTRRRAADVLPQSPQSRPARPPPESSFMR